MKNFDENELIDKAMAGRLNVEEQQLWEALLAERPDLEADLEIGRAMRAIAKPLAVSSNFTALVMQEIKSTAPERRSGWTFSWLSWPRLIKAAGVAVVIGAMALQITHQQKVEKQQVAQTVRSFAGGVAAIAARPQTEVQPEAVVTLLQDFDAIRNLPVSASDVDTTLLTALNQ